MFLAKRRAVAADGKDVGQGPRPLPRRSTGAPTAYALFSALGAGALLLTATAGAQQPPVKRRSAPPTPAFASVRPSLDKFCVPCHSAASPAANLDLSRTDEKSVLADRRRWRVLAERVEKGEMPPPGSPPLPAAQKRAMVAYVRGTLERAERAEASGKAPRDPGPALLRRLTRAEYDRTVSELVGVPFDSAEAVGMPADPAGENFDSVAVSALGVPPTLLEKYAAAADKALEMVVSADDSGKVSAPRRGGTAKLQQAHDRLFFARPGKDGAPREAAAKVVGRFARRAWRRPVTETEAGQLLALYDRSAAAGRGHERSVALALKAALLSPHFLFRIEGRPGEKPGTVVAVGDHELAARLSYFLWSGPPDEELSALADQGRLSADPATVEKQVRRMLADPKADALTERFLAQWLHIDKLGEARPSREFFPSFTPSLREAMYRETATFFDAMRSEDRPVLEFLDADFTFVNAELARHYGIPFTPPPAETGPDGKPKRNNNRELVRVALNPDSHRGGLLGMGSVLALTSHTYRTSPTLRGKWVLDVIFGTPPPPPPPGVSQIEEGGEKGKEAKSFRELLTQHATQPSCSGCHNKMDPLGFALENYDAVGRWRTTAGGGAKLDTSARLPDGRALDGADALKEVVWERRGEFVRNLAGRTLSYALGRDLTGSDDLAVREVVSRLEKNDHKFSALVLGVVESYPFRHRRAAVPVSDAPASKPAKPAATPKKGKRT